MKKQTPSLVSMRWQVVIKEGLSNVEINPSRTYSELSRRHSELKIYHDGVGVVDVALCDIDIAASDGSWRLWRRSFGEMIYAVTPKSRYPRYYGAFD